MTTSKDSDHGKLFLLLFAVSYLTPVLVILLFVSPAVGTGLLTAPVWLVVSAIIAAGAISLTKIIKEQKSKRGQKEEE